MSVVFCPIEVSATNLLIVQDSYLPGVVVSESDFEASMMKRLRPTRAVVP
jgi:hypothetical protein